MKCWQLFVKASRILSQNVSSHTDIEKADLMLWKFCKQFQLLFGKDNVSCNMHLHNHLKDCLLDYGPIHSFWRFSFERLNGHLGKFPNNNRSIEMQIMRKLTTSHFLTTVKLPEEFSFELSALCPSYDQNINELSFCSKHTLQIEELSSCVGQWDIENGREHYQAGYQLLSFDRDDLNVLLKVYQALYQSFDRHVEVMPSSYKKFGRRMLCGTHIGSMSCFRNKKRAEIMAYWTDMI